MSHLIDAIHKKWKKRRRQNDKSWPTALHSSTGSAGSSPIGKFEASTNCNWNIIRYRQGPDQTDNITMVSISLVTSPGAEHQHQDHDQIDSISMVSISMIDHFTWCTSWSAKPSCLRRQLLPVTLKALGGRKILKPFFCLIEDKNEGRNIASNVVQS